VRGTLLGTKDAAKTVGEFVTLTEQALTDALKQALELIKQHAPDELPAEGDAPTVTLSAGIPTNVASTFGGINIPFGELKSPPLAERFWPLITDHPQAMVITYLSTAEEVVGGPGRNFFANRRGGKRHHVGLDIYCKEGDVVVACAPGRIVNFYRFYRTSTGEESFALFVEHDGVVVNYGEVRQDARQKFGWKIGDNVTGGQKIAEVSSTKMIHLETYVPGTKQNSSWMAGDAKPASLLNPTMLLLTLASGAKRIGVNGTTTVTAGSAKPTDGAGGAMTDEDLLTMARTMYGEARNQPAAGQEAVGHVIMNRVRRNKSFYGGNNITKVCKMGNGGQFNCWMPSDSNFSLIRNLVRGANPMFNQCLEIAEKVIRGQVADNTKDSTHYLNPDTVASMPSWATKSRETVKIKDHQFYGHVDD
jgi:murein DD-endopeptidase MepM/ murein hydrolase activator NlpD